MPDDTRALIGRNEFLKRFTEFIEEDELVSREFWKRFGSRKAEHQIPFPSVFDCVNHGVCYDYANCFDLRMVMTLVFPDDMKLFVDIATFVSERYVNNPAKPAGTLTLCQFKADLTRRLIQVGF